MFAQPLDKQLSEKNKQKILPGFKKTFTIPQSTIYY